MTTFKTKGYDFRRKSEHKTFTHAVIFRNLLWARPSTPLGATFHITEELAKRNAVVLSRRSHLEVVAVVEVERI
jgi:hypothetical protein